MLAAHGSCSRAHYFLRLRLALPLLLDGFVRLTGFFRANTLKNESIRC